jgi:AcrR family transcriptional regulator
MAVSIKIQIHESLYVKDPEETKLGQEIINKSILLINKLGIDKFTLKKLASAIDSNEPTIYRYFTSKHQLLMYLFAWYWSWIEYRIDSETNNLKNPVEKLKIVIKALSESASFDPNFSHIQEDILAHIVMKESAKSYLTDELSQEKKELIYQSYYGLCDKISAIIRDVNVKYPNPEALAISIIRITHEQIFFSKYLPKFTKLKSTNEEISDISFFVSDIAFSVLMK